MKERIFVNIPFSHRQTYTQNAGLQSAVGIMYCMKQVARFTNPQKKAKFNLHFDVDLRRRGHPAVHMNVVNS